MGSLEEDCLGLAYPGYFLYLANSWKLELDLGLILGQTCCLNLEVATINVGVVQVVQLLWFSGAVVCTCKAPAPSELEGTSEL